MKKSLVAGMIALSITSIHLNVLAAGPVAGKTTAVKVREALDQYAKDVKIHAFKGVESAAGLQKPAFESAKESLLKSDVMSKLSTEVRNGLSRSIQSGSKDAAVKIEALAMIVATKKYSQELRKQDSTLADSIDRAADASAKVLSHSDLVGSMNKAQEAGGIKLTEAEVSMAAEAIKKMETLQPEIVIKYETAEREAYTQIMEAYSKNIESGMLSEVAMVKGIMEVKKVSQKEAFELLKKLKECLRMA